MPSTRRTLVPTRPSTVIGMVTTRRTMWSTTKNRPIPWRRCTAAMDSLHGKKWFGVNWLPWWWGHKTSGAVVALAPYGETGIECQECVNHAHKHMGTALLNLTKPGNLGGCGYDWLTKDILSRSIGGWLSTMLVIVTVCTALSGPPYFTVCQLMMILTTLDAPFEKTHGASIRRP